MFTFPLKHWPLKLWLYHCLSWYKVPPSVFIICTWNICLTLAHSLGAVFTTFVLLWLMARSVKTFLQLFTLMFYTKILKLYGIRTYVFLITFNVKHFLQQVSHVDTNSIAYFFFYLYVYLFYYFLLLCTNCMM